MMKKGQGALEFLMTYGWAFLVILIMIGALAYFGVLNPSRFLPDKCMWGSQVQCKQFVIKDCNGVFDAARGCIADDATLVMQLTNSFGSSVNVCGADLETDNANLGQTTAAVPAAGAAAAGAYQISWDDDAVPLDGVLNAGDLTVATAGDIEAACGATTDADNLWPEGETKTLLVKMGGGQTLVSGDKLKINVCLKYFTTSTTSTFAKDVCGEVYTTIQ